MRLGLIFLVLAATVSVVTIGSLPPRAAALADVAEIPPHVRGVMHVHSRASGGSGTVDQIAAAAARAGLDFIVVTDHGDAVRFPGRPTYRHGVLCIDAVEVRTRHGHIMALGLTEGAPYPLGGDPEAALEDIARLGGMSIVAHPTSGKPPFSWGDWDASFDGIEWLNADREWRDEAPLSLSRALLAYPWRRVEVLASLLDRPAELLERWDALTARRPVVALAGADAHANIGFSDVSNRYGDRAMLALPAYEQMFRTFSIALPGARLTGDADRDARDVLQQIRAGHVYTAIDAWGGPARLAFSATSGGRTAGPGERLDARGPVAIRVRSTAPPQARVRLLRNGVVIAEDTGGHLEYVEPSPARGAFRTEVELPARRPGAAPWLLSNPVYVNGGPHPAPAAPRRRIETFVRYADGPVGPEIGIEKNGASKGAFEVSPAVEGTRLRVRYALGGSVEDHAYVALDMRTGVSLADYDRVMFVAGADKPTRLWVQLSMPAPSGNAYWRRSVYLNTEGREVVLRFADFVAVADAPESAPLGDVESVMFMVDQTHTPLGGAGSFWIDNVRFGRER